MVPLCRNRYFIKLLDGLFMASCKAGRCYIFYFVRLHLTSSVFHFPLLIFPVRFASVEF